MQAWLPLLFFGLGMAAVMFLLSRYQAGRYQSYLTAHNATTERMLEEQRHTQEAIARQTAALERIAAALEQRP